MGKSKKMFQSTVHNFIPGFEPATCGDSSHHKTPANQLHYQSDMSQHLEITIFEKKIYLHGDPNQNS